MKKSVLSIGMAVVLLWGSSCSSSNTETANDASTTESVATASDSATAASTDASTGVTTTQTLDTTSFAVMAASSDMFELLSSKEAQSKATHADVKTFAAQMITDHTATSEELKGIATTKNMLLPAAPVPMHQALLTKVSTETKEFDEEYMEAQVTAHRSAVSLFERAAKSETDPQLKAFAAKHLPHLKMHLDMAKKTKEKVD